MAKPSSAGGRDAPGPRPLHGRPEGGGRATAAAGGTYQVYEGQKFPAASIGLMRGHVYGLVIAQDGAIGQEDGGVQHLAGHQRHVCGAGCTFVCLCLCPSAPFPCVPVCVCVSLGVCARRAGGTPSPSAAPAGAERRARARRRPRGRRAGRAGSARSRASAPRAGWAGAGRAIPERAEGRQR